MLNDVGASVLGAVMTMMPTRGSGAYSYNYYYYGGNYGDEKSKLVSVNPLPTDTGASAPAVASISNIETGQGPADESDAEQRIDHSP
jgi:hypothetical protein